MTIKSGFFNAVNGDRKYSAVEFDSLLDGIHSDGVYRSYGGELLVTPVGGLTISVDTGRAWFDRTWISNDAPLVLTLAPAYLTQGRIDTVVIDINQEEATRTNSIFVLTGTPSDTPVAPALIDDTYHKQYRLANISVAASQWVLIADDITNYAGLFGTPWATLLLDSNAYADALLATNGVRPGRNILINGDMIVGQRVPNFTFAEDTFSSWDEPIPATMNGYQPTIPDRWRIDLNNLTGTAISFTTKNRLMAGDTISRRWFEIFIEDTTGIVYSPNPDGKLVLSQRILASRLVDARRGFPDAKVMTLSFKCKFTTNPGNYAVEIQDTWNNMSYVTTYPVVNDTLTDVSLTIPAYTLEGLPVGNQEGLRVNFWLVAGSNYTSGSSEISGWNMTNPPYRAHGMTAYLGNMEDEGMCSITDVQLEIGTAATEFDRLSFPEVLSLCQQYYEKIDGWYAVHGVSIGSEITVVIPHIKWSTAKRVYPVLTVTSFTTPLKPTFAYSGYEFTIDQSCDKRTGSGILITVDAEGFGTDNASTYGILKAGISSEL